MLNRRWWDLAALAVSAVVVTFGLVFPPYGPQDFGLWSVVAVFLLVYLGYLRWRIGAEDPRHYLAITAILVAVVFAGTAFDPAAATLQAFAYPFLWITAPSTKRAIIGNVLLAISVAAGYAVGLGPAGILAGIGVSALSLVFSLALGLWITRIAEVGEERARLLAELQATQGQLAAMHRETGVTEERARLAREIHDTIAQSLTGLVMLAQRAERRLDASEPDMIAARSDLGLIEDMARDALTEARGLVAVVSPIALDTTLADALARLAAGFERETGVAVALEVRAPGLGRELEVVLLRASQEGLANVRKHAQAQHIELTVEMEAGMARLIVRDDGVGPGPDDAPGFGLAGLRDRVALAGGRVDFGAAPGGGAELRVELPVEASDRVPSEGSAA